MSDDPLPTVPADRLDAGGWMLDEHTTETVFSLPTTRIEGHTALYQQPEIRDRIREQFACDLPWRFFFATRLTFNPPLSPGIGPLSLFPTVLASARKEFVADLRDRGFEDIDRGRTQRARTESGDRLRLTKYTARFEASEIVAGIEAWFGVWIHDGEFRLAGGAYPTSGLSGVDLDPSNYRAELLGLIRAVE